MESPGFREGSAKAKNYLRYPSWLLSLLFACDYLGGTQPKIGSPSKLPTFYFFILMSGISIWLWYFSTFAAVLSPHRLQTSPSRSGLSVLPQTVQRSADFLPFLPLEPNTTYLPCLLPRLIFLFLFFSRLVFADSSVKIFQLTMPPQETTWFLFFFGYLGFLGISYYHTFLAYV